MLISPPFLLPRKENESEDEWLDRCMHGGRVGDGAFPLSFNLGWHGGVHLTAPMNGTQSESVRAVADGTVVLMRSPTPRDDTHPLNYRGWTDNGCVVLRHDTEIGEGASATVSFFSITMHLSKIEPTVQVGRQICRKSALGVAGQIDGSLERKIHLEIVCDDANLACLVGRAKGDLSTGQDGRLDAIYGQIYFLLPTNTSFYAQKPLDHMCAAHIQPPKPSSSSATPSIRPLEAIYTSTDDAPLIVALRYAGGEGTEGPRGSSCLTTLCLDGTRLGEKLVEPDGEYCLYKRANEISNAYPAAARPAPSAVYELLRFGRVVNTANETLHPADVPNWREVRYPGGKGWVNLNAPNVRKFSDADFPQWQQWRLIDDSADQDSRCDSPILRGWLDINGDGRVIPDEAKTRLVEPILASKLARTICKFPTEWDATTIDQRWSWLKNNTEENPGPITESNFVKLRAHIQALALFMSDIGLPPSHWHFNPLEFIRHLRGNLWLDERQVALAFPSSKPENRVMYGVHLNRTASKYHISSSRHRLTHFLGQGAHESSQLNLMVEAGNTKSSKEPEGNTWFNGAAETYFNQYIGRNGNIDSSDHIKFRGRGLKQLTGRYNYGYYWAYRGWLSIRSFQEPWWAPSRPDRAPVVVDPQIIGNNPSLTIDAGGWYWESTPLRGLSNGRGRSMSSINVLIDKSDFNDDIIRSVSKMINGGEFGLSDRKIQTRRVAGILMDAVE